MTWLGGLTCAVALLLLGSACSAGGGPPTATPRPGTSTSSSASAPVSSAATPRPVPPAPDQGACYTLGFGRLSEPTNTSRPVPCSARHDAQTIHVGRLDTVVDGHAVAVDSDRVLRQLSTQCPRRLAAHIGGSREDRELSRFEVVWFSPTLAQSDLGANWYRCDIVAIAGKDTLFPLPAPRRLKGVLDEADRAAPYGLCGTTAPGDPGFSRVICARQHSWRAVATIRLPGGKDYPGQRAVSALRDAACRDRVRDRAEDPLKFRYGWEWPTGEQWRAGQRFGYCWAPD